MKIVSINGFLGLFGKNISFLNEPFFGLQVGQEVTQIGDGRENGSIRTDQFNYPVTYMGAIYLQYSKREKMFAFKIVENTYLTYGCTEHFLFTEKAVNKQRTKSYTRFYKPVFTLRPV